MIIIIVIIQEEKSIFFNIRVVSEKIEDNYKKKIDRNNAFYFSRHTRINNYE